MTNNEKFKEVFGVNLITNTDLCSIVDCDDIPCSKCLLNGNSVEFMEYKEPKESEEE